MKAKLTFDLKDLDDRLDYTRCNQSLDMANALYEMIEYFVSAKQNELLSEEWDIIDRINSAYIDILEDNGINLDELL